MVADEYDVVLKYTLQVSEFAEVMIPTDDVQVSVPVAQLPDRVKVTVEPCIVLDGPYITHGPVGQVGPLGLATTVKEMVKTIDIQK